ncbi:biotin transporter BioY [Alkalicoccus luteus]|uniref:Biotin transporter n=1 Tax=Alkalicoccus luteus TaxID=1237094 RepID=A0A969PPZ9_9BACI|nr:biotin transporter BioY [Alkalicoccus luteus]NJP38261.1 biotin transporter BioY [Alkalicoccus luteus]
MKHYSKARAITFAAMFIALMAIGANMAAIVTIGAVPLTFQTVVAVLAGLILGRKLGTFAIIGYILLGAAGAPVFAGFSSGMAALASPTFGFILSFPVIAFVTGLISDRSASSTKAVYFTAGLAGLAANYGIGVPYVYLHSTFILGVPDLAFWAVAAGMIPFFIKDFILVFFTAALAVKLKPHHTSRPALRKAA